MSHVDNYPLSLCEAWPNYLFNVVNCRAEDSSSDGASRSMSKPRMQNGRAHPTPRHQNGVANGGLQNGVPTFDVMGTAMDSRYMTICRSQCITSQMEGLSCW